MYIVIIVVVVIILIIISSGFAYFLMPAEKEAEKEAEKKAEKEAEKEVKQLLTPVISIKGCEADEAKLTCSSGKIKTANIKYGRWDNTICPHSTVNPNTRSVFKEYNLSDAIGQSSYSIKDKNLHKNINEDILPGVFKHWSLDYTCE